MQTSCVHGRPNIDPNDAIPDGPLPIPSIPSKAGAKPTDAVDVVCLPYPALWWRQGPEGRDKVYERESGIR